MNRSDTLRTYSANWLETIRPSVRPNTMRAYEQSLRVRAIPVLGDTPMEQISRAQLKGWFAALLLKYKAGTATQALITLHTLLAAAVEDEVIPKNPASSLRRAMRAVLKERRTENRPPLSREQLTAFLEAARSDPATYPAMVLLAFTGIRVGEARGLQWQDFDFARKLIHIERQVYENGQIAPLKTGAGLRTIPMAEKIRKVFWTVKTERQMLEEKFRLPASPWVIFPDLLNGCSPRTARHELGRAIKAALKKAGIQAHFSSHSLRHTIATVLVEEGADLKFVQNLLGHASITITADRYARFARMRTGVLETFEAVVDGAGAKKDA